MIFVSLRRSLYSADKSLRSIAPTSPSFPRMSPPKKGLGTSSALGRRMVPNLGTALCTDPGKFEEHRRRVSIGRGSFKGTIDWGRDGGFIRIAGSVNPRLSRLFSTVRSNGSIYTIPNVPGAELEA